MTIRISVRCVSCRSHRSHCVTYLYRYGDTTDYRVFPMKKIGTSIISTCESCLGRPPEAIGSSTAGKLLKSRTPGTKPGVKTPLPIAMEAGAEFHHPSQQPRTQVLHHSSLEHKSCLRLLQPRVSNSACRALKPRQTSSQSLQI